MSETESSDPATILVTGGCGYIGSHTITCLLEQGYNVVVVDNLSNSSKISLDRVAEICKLDEEQRKKRLVIHEVDVCDEAALRKVFETSPTFQACIHFAGLKVGTTRIARYRHGNWLVHVMTSNSYQIHSNDVIP
jgi:UDP-glucose 4-epimerase